ncbi:hypothetical protein Efla_006739 [Eimeria flavescens]
MRIKAGAAAVAFGAFVFLFIAAACQQQQQQNVGCSTTSFLGLCRWGGTPPFTSRARAPLYQLSGGRASPVFRGHPRGAQKATGRRAVHLHAWGPPRGSPRGPLPAQRPVQPWDHLEVFPLPQNLGPPKGPQEAGEDVGELLDNDSFEGGPLEDPAAARLPRGEFRPKQSLGQNFLADPNICNRIVKAFRKAVAAATQHEQQQQQQQEGAAAAAGSRVVEVGPGTGALTRLLYPVFPDMLAVEIDLRAISLLSQRIPGLQVLHEDVLQQVEAAVVRVDFRHEDDATLLEGVQAADLKRVLFAAFGQRRKMLRQSLKSILPAGASVPAAFESLRPQALSPHQFIELTACLFGRGALPAMPQAGGPPGAALLTPDKVPVVWRKLKHGDY